jgi:hypothetical protein
MDVVGSDGRHVGTVDYLMDNRRIKLTKSDPDAHGEHHIIPLDLVESVGDQVRLNVMANQARERWEKA